ncbi:MAG: T9SS type A sorting domain-containing protein [Xanthomarina gelatinilytica]|uniref:T9SS type A sorting domain-containing protein n=1 Tax=Xanthomarina gelatinilytica TaxID=1137281 RepID=UPI003A8B4CFB
MSIYPVSTEATINISTDLIIDSIVMFDLLGKQIMDIEKPSNRINVSNLSEGMYLLKIQTKNKTVIKRFVKN